MEGRELTKRQFKKKKKKNITVILLLLSFSQFRKNIFIASDNLVAELKYIYKMLKRCLQYMPKVYCDA